MELQWRLCGDIDDEWWTVDKPPSFATVALDIREESDAGRRRRKKGFHRSVRCLRENQELGTPARRAFEHGRVRQRNNFMEYLGVSSARLWHLRSGLTQALEED